MAYQALYRKWRPKTFDEVIGQSHIINTLKNEISENKIAHAYLFTGTRGTGKTSTAKIFARAVNCKNPHNGNPCNECDVCNGILKETLLDVIEIDAASNTGVDNIREIIEQCRYASSAAQYKIYIIDEVHMLSKNAFNALLKTLEEPPAHIIFILATTEIHDVPATILSRCQRFDFKTISVFEIVEAMKKILIEEKITIDDDALEYVAFLGDGSMRDSLSILDRCIAYKTDNITYNDVIDVVGALDDTILFEIIENISKGNTKDVFEMYEKCISGGKNPDNFAVMFLNCYREILKYQTCSDIENISKKRYKLVQKAATVVTSAECIRAIDVITNLIHDLKTVSNTGILIECTLIKLSQKELYCDADSIAARIEAIENKLLCGVPVRSAPVADKSTQQSGDKSIAHDSAEEEISYPEPPPLVEPDAYSDMKTQDTAEDKKAEIRSVSGVSRQIAEKWGTVLDYFNQNHMIVLYCALAEAEVRANGDTLDLVFADYEAKDDFDTKQNRELLKKAIGDTFGIDVNIKCYAKEEADTESAEDLSVDIFSNLQKQADNFPMNIKIE